MRLMLCNHKNNVITGYILGMWCKNQVKLRTKTTQVPKNSDITALVVLKQDLFPWEQRKTGHWAILNSDKKKSYL